MLNASHKAPGRNLLVFERLRDREDGGVWHIRGRQSLTPVRDRSQTERLRNCLVDGSATF